MKLLVLLGALLSTACGAGPSPETTPPPAGHCPAGSHYDECAHGSCPACDDCVAECMPD